MSYARARLWLGITGVGSLVLLSLIALFFRVPARLLPVNEQPIAQDALALAAVLLTYAMVQAPFDLFGGHILPTEYGRSRAPFRQFFARWFRGVVAHGAILLGIGLILLLAARTGGFGGTMAAFVAVTVLLLAGQDIMAAILGASYERQEARQPGSPPVVLARESASYFTGGIVGLPGLERIVIPARWQEIFSPEQRAVVVLRRVGVVRTGSRLRGLALAFVVNAVGFAAACGLGGGTSTVAGLVTTSLWFTLWQFLCLLVLPSPSQGGVFEADAFARRNGVSEETLTTIIRTLDQDQDDEPARPSGVERIFHPLPSVERRVAALPHPERVAPGAWHAARMAIYLSWAGMSFLSRAVHCNSGRPDVWVFLPSD
jgi:hypothetical protein